MVTYGYTYIVQVDEVNLNEIVIALQEVAACRTLVTEKTKRANKVCYYR